MAAPVYSLKKILGDLNGFEKNGEPKSTPWNIEDNTYALGQASISFNQINALGSAMALKVLKNGITGEIKIYLAKVLEDAPESKLLP
jgi:hypothetical protein